MRKYFMLVDDLDRRSRWFLDALFDASGNRLDSRDFTYGKAIKVTPIPRISLFNDEASVDAKYPLRISLYKKRRGTPLDFTFTNADMPVVTSDIGGLLAGIAGADIQRIPVLIESRSEAYEIINVVSLVDCIDIRRSEIEWFSDDNDVRPDLAGEPEMVTHLVIDPMRAGGHHIFRLKGWDIPIIVSNAVKEALEQARATGIKFQAV